MSSASLPDIPPSGNLEDQNVTKKSNFKAFCVKNFFLIGLVLVVLIGALIPEIGHKEGPLRPDITASWVSVIVCSLNFV